MKKLEFETSKGSFVLVDMHQGTERLQESLIGIKLESYRSRINLSNITEKQASEVVDSFDLFGNINVGYKNYAEEEPVLNTAKESLHSLLKSKGVHLFEYTCSNQDCENGFINQAYGDKLICSVCEDKDDLTYSNPYLFKKL